MAVRLDLHARLAEVDGRVVELIREFALAETFLRHAGQVRSRELLLAITWGYDLIRVPTSSTCTCAICDASSATT